MGLWGRGGLAVMAAMAAASCARTEVPRTWLVANALAKTVSTDIDNRGVRAVAPHVKDLEKALAMGKQGQPEVVGDIRYVLTDGPGAILPGAQAADGPRKIKAVPNPYPGISLALGAYYNEVGRPQDALRVLALGLVQDTVLGVPGKHAPLLINEHAVANTALKRWSDALADDDRGLRLAQVDPRDRSLLLRGRGFALTELGRLDEAAASYRESLVLEPGNPRAVGEVQYIERLRAGAAPVPAVLTMPNAPRPD